MISSAKVISIIAGIKASAILIPGIGTNPAFSNACIRRLITARKIAATNSSPLELPPRLNASQPRVDTNLPVFGSLTTTQITLLSLFCVFFFNTIRFPSFMCFFIYYKVNLFIPNFLFSLDVKLSILLRISIVSFTSFMSSTLALLSFFLFLLYFLL